MDKTSHESILDLIFNYMQSRVKWSSAKLKLACPPKKKKCEDEADIGPPCMEKWSYLPPNQICSKTDSSCYIKMQDPYAPCCCEPTKPQPTPCPPKHHRQSRKPICGCDLCKKKCTSSHKCCSDLTATYHSASSNFKFFGRG